MKCCEELCLFLCHSQDHSQRQDQDQGQDQGHSQGQDQNGGAPELVRLCPGLSGVVLVWFSPGLRCRCLRVAGRLA